MRVSLQIHAFFKSHNEKRKRRSSSGSWNSPQNDKTGACILLTHAPNNVQQQRDGQRSVCLSQWCYMERPREEGIGGRNLSKRVDRRLHFNCCLTGADVWQASNIETINLPPSASLEAQPNITFGCFCLRQISIIDREVTALLVFILWKIGDLGITFQDRERKWMMIKW